MQQMLRNTHMKARSAGGKNKCQINLQWGAVKREMRRIELDKYRKWTLLFSDAFLKGLDCVEEALLIR